MSDEPKWEYKVIMLSGSERSAESRLNLFGSAGWELVAVYGLPMQIAYLKRPIRPDAPLPAIQGPAS